MSQRFRDLSFTAFALGYLTHFSLKSSFTLTHRNFYSTLVYFIIGYTALVYASTHSLQLELFPSLLLTSLLSTSYISGLLTGLILYRLLFSPLKGFPGPLLAKVTGLWGFYHCLKGNYHRKIRSLFDEYNTDFLRIGPNDIIMRDPAAAQHIYITSE
jgi:branched-subunit amino acid ABC-type transport system permease component